MQVSSSAGAGFINPEFTPAAPALPVATEPASTLDGWQHASPAQPRPLSAEPQQMRTKPLRLDDQPQPGLQRLVDEPPNPLRQPAIAIKPHATIVDAPASRSDAPVPASSSRLLMSEFVTSSLSPGIAAQIAAGGGRGSAAGAMLGNAQWTADGSVSQAFPPGKDGSPLEVGGQLTAAARAAAEVAASAPVAPAAPKADPTEIAALELLLADPANQELIQQFGGELQPLPTWTSVGKGIEARYGADLGGRLYQLQIAQRAVEGEFFQAMDQALKDGPPSPWSSASQKEGGVASERPGWTYGLSPGIADEHWHFDPGAFARHYAQGDAPAQRALAQLHGPDPVQFVPAPDSEAGGSNRWEMAGITLRLGRRLTIDEGLTPDAVVAKDGWAPSRLLRGEHHLDPDHITKLNNKEFVWFDPVHGFSTDPDNVKGDWLDRAFPYIFSAAFTAITFGAGAGVGAAAATSAGSGASAGLTSAITTATGGGVAGAAANGAAMAAVSSATLQLAANGKISFGQLLRSTLSGGFTGGLMSASGLSSLPAGADLGQRLMTYTGRATLQGAIQSVLGGKFRDGAVNSLIGSLAGEVTAQLDAHINGIRGLDPSSASALRLLSRATGSALRLVGSNDPAAGFASDFLGGLIQDGLAAHGAPTAGAGADPTPEAPADPREPQYQLDTGDDSLGLRPGSGEGVRWGGLRGNEPSEEVSERRPVYDFDPDGTWDALAPAPVNAVDRPIAQWVSPIQPAGIGHGVVGGGFQSTPPAGVGGPPGYDPVYDLPSGAPSYRPSNPGLGIRTPPLENVPPPWGANLILGPAMLGVSWAQYLIDRRASGILADNLEAAGVVRPADTDAHHIVPYSDPRGADIRRLLERFGIDINAPENGVFLPNKPGSEAPGAYHPRLNNGDYYRQLHRDFQGVASNQEALEVLQRIRNRLLNNDYPGARPRP